MTTRPRMTSPTTPRFNCSLTRRENPPKAGDTELLKRVIRSAEGTFTGYIRDLESKGMSAEATEGEDFRPPYLGQSDVGVETPGTLN